MSFRINLLWKILTPLGRNDASSVTNSGLFNVLGGRNFIRKLGGEFKLENAPLVLSPTDTFHDTLRATRNELDLTGNRFPYEFRRPLVANRQKLNVSLHLHRGVVCTTIRFKAFDTSSDFDWAELQDLRHDAGLWSLVKKILALVVSGDPKSRLVANDPQVFPAIHFASLSQDGVNWRTRLVELLTGHPGVTEAIVKNVLDKNSFHQIDNSLLLLDKQGVAAYAPLTLGGRAVVSSINRFEHAAAMLQFAAVLYSQIRQETAILDDEKFAIDSPTLTVPASISGQRAWSLLVQEFGLKAKLELMSNPRSEAHPTISKSRTRILVITVTSVESTALHESIRETFGRDPKLKRIDGFSYQNFGILGDFELLHQISGMGSGGVDGSQESIGRSIAAIKPDAVLMLGIAFGVDPDKQAIGTILVSKQLQNYELQRLGDAEASIHLRGDRVTASPKLLNWVAHAALSWDPSHSRIKLGLVLSGEKLIDNKDFKDQLVKLTGEPIGGEMEGAGLYVACQNAKADWILIKSVCDWADGNKSSNKDEYQSLAAKSAAKFFVHLLQRNSE